MNVIVCECWIVYVNEIRERVFVNDFASLLAGNHCARNRNAYMGPFTQLSRGRS